MPCDGGGIANGENAVVDAGVALMGETVGGCTELPFTEPNAPKEVCVFVERGNAFDPGAALNVGDEGDAG